MLAVDYWVVEELANEFGAIDCFWRESNRSFTGFVAEVWFEALPREFAVQWSAVVGRAVMVRARDNGPGRFMVSVPCQVPVGEVRLGYVSRGSRVQFVL
jgi:hypothetical protein